MDKKEHPVLVARKDCIGEYLGKYELSLTDLCRLYEVSVLGMKMFLMKKGMIKECDKSHHPKLVETLILERQNEFAEGKSSPETLTSYGLLRKPSRCAVLNKKGDYKPNDVWDDITFDKRWNQTEINRVKELASLQMDCNVIADYVFGGMEVENLRRIMRRYKAKIIEQGIWVSFDDDIKNGGGDTKLRKNSGKKTEGPLLLVSDKGELKQLVQEGYNVKDIIMLVGDKEPVVRRERERFVREHDDKIGMVSPSKKYNRYIIYGQNKEQLYRQAFQAYIGNMDQTMSELAKAFHITRSTYATYIKKYLDKWGTDEEREALAKRKEAAEEMRTTRVKESKSGKVME